MVSHGGECQSAVLSRPGATGAARTWQVAPDPSKRSENLPADFASIEITQKACDEIGVEKGREIQVLDRNALVKDAVPKEAKDISCILADGRCLNRRSVGQGPAEMGEGLKFR